MRNIISIVLGVILTACAPTVTPAENSPTYVEAHVKVYIDPRIPTKYHSLIIKSIMNSRPSNIVNIEVTTLPDMKTAGSNHTEVSSTVLLAEDLSKFSDAEIVFQIGHEMGHADPDVRALDAYAKEFTCDQWGVLTVLDLGYSGYEAAQFFKRFDFPASYSHPSSAERHKRVLDTVKMRGNK